MVGRPVMHQLVDFSKARLAVVAESSTLNSRRQRRQKLFAQGLDDQLVA
jgi:hypothetical protein